MRAIVKTPLSDLCDGFLIDLDGVVWVGGELIEGADEAVAALRAEGKGVVFLTNDPRGSRAEFAARLTSLGIPASVDDIVAAGAVTAEAAAARLAGRAAPNAFVVGSGGLRTEVREAGIELAAGDAPGAGAVIVGGHDRFDYEELRAASRLLDDDATIFLATGRDATFPMPGGRWPATGAILAAIETASGRTATVCGKPEQPMFDAARRRLPWCRRLGIVGDNPASDIDGGRRAGIATFLVAPGAPSNTEEVEADHLLPSLRALTE
jgi:glycerol-1-phosphatase